MGPAKCEMKLFNLIFNGCIELGEWIYMWFHPKLHNAFDYISMLVFNLRKGVPSGMDIYPYTIWFRGCLQILGKLLLPT